MSPTHHQDNRHTVAPVLEETLPQVALHDHLAIEEKHEVDMVEDAKLRLDEDPNSPEAILQRYPLLREMSESQLDKLNRQVRRRIDIWMLPMLTLCLMINYLDRSNVTNARVAGMQEDMHMNDVQWVSWLLLGRQGVSSDLCSVRRYIPLLRWLHCDSAARITHRLEVQAENRHPPHHDGLVDPDDPLPLRPQPRWIRHGPIRRRYRRGTVLPRRRAHDLVLVRSRGAAVPNGSLAWSSDYLVSVLDRNQQSLHTADLRPETFLVDRSLLLSWRTWTVSGACTPGSGVSCDVTGRIGGG